MSKTTLFGLISIATIAIACNLLLLDNYHTWGDDFALYLNQGKCLANGNYLQLLETNKQMMDNGISGPYLYPIGYPLLIAPLFMVFGFKLIYFKVYTFLFFLLGLFFLYRLLRLFDIDTRIILITIISILLSPGYIIHHNKILSDIPAFAFTIITMFYYMRSLVKEKPGYTSIFNKDIILTSFFLGLAIFTRTTNIALVPAILFTSFYNYVMRSKRLKYFFIHTSSILSFTILLFIINTYVPLSRNSNEISRMLNTDLTSSLFTNLKYYAQLLAEPLSTPIEFIVNQLMAQLNLQGPKNLALIISVVLVWTLYVAFIIKFFKEGKPFTTFKLFVTLFIFTTIALYMFWPSRQGPRFLFSVYPFIFLFIYTTAFKTKWGFRTNSVRNSFVIIICLLICLPGIASFQQIIQKENTLSAYNSKSEPGTDSFNEMMHFISDSVSLKPGEVIGFNKPRALYFYTGKVSYKLLEKNFPVMKYILIREGIDDLSFVENENKYMEINEFGILRLYRMKEAME